MNDKTIDRIKKRNIIFLMISAIVLFAFLAYIVKSCSNESVAKPSDNVPLLSPFDVQVNSFFPKDYTELASLEREKQKRIEEQKRKESLVLLNTVPVNALEISTAPETKPVKVESKPSTTPVAISGKVSEAQKEHQEWLEATLKSPISFKTPPLSANTLDENVYSKYRVKRPVSPYILNAGSVIKCQLITGIISEISGWITAQVSQNVYNSVDGKFLLIPCGSKLLGRYNNDILFHQSRLKIVFERIIMPDGSYIQLDNMPGISSNGYTGVSDKVNYHFDKLFTAAILSSVLSVAVRKSQGDVGDNPTIAQETAGEMANDIGSTGRTIVDRQLRVPPTIEIQPGYKFSVFVNKDIVMQPYKG